MKLQNLNNGEWFYDGKQWFKKIKTDEKEGRVEATQIGYFKSFWFPLDLEVEIKK